jgi:hypothetical protein
MMSTERSTVVGVFEDRDQAERAVGALRRLGFDDSQIGMVTQDQATPAQFFTLHAKDTKWEAGAATGALTGGAAGSLLGVAVAANIIPGVGPMIAGGVLAGILASAATGAAGGMLIGALIGLGIPEEEAGFYDNEFRTGRTLVTVRANGRYAEVVNLLRGFDAYDISTPRSEMVTR